MLQRFKDEFDDWLDLPYEFVSYSLTDAQLESAPERVEFRGNSITCLYLSAAATVFMRMVRGQTKGPWIPIRGQMVLQHAYDAVEFYWAATAGVIAEFYFDLDLP